MHAKNPVISARWFTAVLAVAALVALRWPVRKEKADVPFMEGTAALGASELIAAAMAPDEEGVLPPDVQPGERPSRLDDSEIETAFRKFRHWISEFAAADPIGRHALLSAGKELAVLHRQAMKQLIPEDPQRALKRALPMVIRQQLPLEVTSLLEKRISSRGHLRVVAVWPAESVPPIRRIVEAEGKRYEAYTFGRRTSQASTEQAFVTGIAVDELLALDERPLRVLEPGEIPDASKLVFENCPVSGQILAVPRKDSAPLPITKQTPAVEAGGTLHYLCSGGHIFAFEQQLIAQEGGTGGPIVPTGPIPSSAATGVKSILYVRVAFPETTLEPQTEAAAYEMMRQVNDWYVENSYGNLYLLTTVTPLVILPHPEAFYNGMEGDEYGLYADALVAAAAMGYDYRSHDLDIVAYTGGPGNFNGAGSIGGRGLWLKSINVGTAVHELGHNLGLYHANLWNTGGRSVIGNGSHAEYGNSFDTMGPASAGNLQFNAAFKYQLDWLKKEMVHEIRRSGVYRIHAYDQARLDPASRYGFKVKKDGERSYWGEFRQRYGASNTWLRDGLLLNWSPWSKSAGGTHLLDTTPGTPDGTADSALTIGRTFSDFESGVHLTPVGKGWTNPESIDVVVNLGTYPGNQPPVAAVSAGQAIVDTGVTVSFTAAATDPDGDELAYFWDFGDKTFSNMNSLGTAKSWSTAGDYVVRCLVSDMKGGTASDSVIVRVGSPTTFAISGQITSGGQPLANVRVHNSLSGANYRGSYTDTDGNYMITGLAGANVTVGAMLYGYSFSAAFANPVTVGPDFTGANFSAVQIPRVSISATDPDATEGTDPGSFTITRTGSTTSALTVAVLAPTGSASQGGDYTLSPDTVYSGGSNNWYQFTIASGQATRLIHLSASDDTSAEGPETATLELLPTASYIIAGPQSATINIQDADSSLPLVSVEVSDTDAGEVGDSATFVVSRSGPTGNPLTVNFTTAGTATNGSDYAIVGTSVIIPAGQPSADIVVSPIQDTSIEGDEDIIITLSNSGNYLRAPSAQNAGAFIVDDDVPVLTISAPDAAASEAGQDPATFVITRTGSTSGPLIVNYALAGSAHHGVDYAMLPGVLTIPPGASSASITVVPVDDAIGEPAQTIVIQIRGGTSYVAGNPGLASASLADNDAPVVTVGLSDGLCGETAGTGQFRFTTTGSGSGNITVRYTLGGTATPGDDYTALTGTLSMGRNTTSTITVIPTDDMMAEGLETITVTLDSDAAYTSFLGRTATLNLLDNDGTSVSVTAGSTYFDEGNDTAMQFRFAREGSTADPLDIHYTMSGTATNGVDYRDYFAGTELPGLVTIPAGQAVADIWARIINDSLKEGTETVILTITSDPAIVFGIASATQYLPDNEVHLTKLRFSDATGGGSESAGTVSIPVTLSAASSAPITVEYAIAGGSATGGIDYALTSGTLTFDPGVTSRSIPLTVIDDLFDEPAQTVILELKNAWNSEITTGTHTFTIIDNDNPPPPSIGFAATASTGVENTAAATLLVSLSATQPAPVTVHYAATGGTATGGGVDYTLVPGTLTFAAGETVKMISLTIIDDILNEANETVTVTLDTPVGASLGVHDTHVYTINNVAGTLAITPDGGFVTGGAGSGPFVPPNGIYTLRNTGDTNFTWTATASAAWIGLSPASGTLTPDQTADVSLFIDAGAVALLPGSYTGTVSFTNTTNGQGNGTRGVTLNVLPGGPTDITLSAASIAENNAPNATVGLLSATDPDAGDTHTFALAAGTGSTDNASFAISGNELKLILGADFETQSSYSIRVRATDNGGLFFEKTFAIAVTDAIEAPDMLAEPVFTGGTGNTIYWSPQPGAGAFEVQMSADIGFIDIASSGWIGETQHLFTGLTDGNRYWFRVRARAAGDLTNEGPWSITLSSVQDATAPVLTLGGGETQWITAQPEYLLSGTAIDTVSGLSGITVNGIPANLIAGGAAWSRLIPLTPGANALDIVASDNALPVNQSSERRSVYYATDSRDFDRDGLPDGWEFSNGLDLFDDGSQQPVNGPSGDGDLDGMDNLMEYSVNRDPKRPDGPAPFALTTTRAPGGESFGIVTYNRRISAPGIAFEVQFSPDASTWAAEPENIEPVSTVPDPDGITETVTVRILPALSDPDRRLRLIRLRITATHSP